jgi:peptidoglycan/LPS O-acetylase OafA/YrhL
MILIGHAMDISIRHVAGRAALVDSTARLGAALHGFFSFSRVVGFIVVSGYCIARSCERQKDLFSVPRYFIMRVTRIYPLLIVAAAAHSPLIFASLNRRLHLSCSERSSAANSAGVLPIGRAPWPARRALVAGCWM